MTTTKKIEKFLRHVPARDGGDPQKPWAYCESVGPELTLAIPCATESDARAEYERRNGRAPDESDYE